MLHNDTLHYFACYAGYKRYLSVVTCLKVGQLSAPHDDDDRNEQVVQSNVTKGCITRSEADYLEGGG